jgi:hypothetical protein
MKVDHFQLAKVMRCDTDSSDSYDLTDSQQSETSVRVANEVSSGEKNVVGLLLE